LGIFLGIYWHTDNLAIGVLVGMLIHFIILGFAHPISQSITSFFGN